MSRAAALLRGPLSIHKKRGLEERFFLLLPDRLEYYADEEQVASGNPRGRIDFPEVARFGCLKEDLVFTLVSGSELCLRPPGEVALQAWHKALQDLLPAPQDAEDEDESSEDVPELYEGPLSVQRKGELVEKHFVLREHCLEYFQQREDWREGKKPRGVCALSDVLGLEGDSGGHPDGFLLRLAKPLNPLLLQASSSAEAERWVRELAGLLVPRLGAAAVTHPLYVGGETMSSARSARGSLFGTDDEKALSQGEAPPVLTRGAAGSDLGLRLEPGLGRAAFPDEQAGGSSASVAAAHDTDDQEPSFASSPERGGTSTVLCQGLLCHVKKSKKKPMATLRELKYFVLSEESLDYFRAREEFEACQEPRGQVALSDVRAVRMGEYAMRLDLGERQLLLEAPEETGVEERADLWQLWGAAWEAALGERLSWDGPGESQRSSILLEQSVLEPSALEQTLSAVAWEEPPLAPEEAETEEQASEQVSEQVSLLEESASMLEEAPSYVSEGRPQAAASREEAEAAEEALGALQGLLLRRRAGSVFRRRSTTTVRSLFANSRRDSQGRAYLEPQTFRDLCSEAGLDLSEEKSAAALHGLALGRDRGKLHPGDLEAALRRRMRGLPAVAPPATPRSRRSSGSSGSTAPPSQSPRAAELADRARAGLRSDSYARGGATWARAFEHYARRGRHSQATIDLPGFISLVRRAVKISSRELPDSVLEGVYMSIEKRNRSSISFLDFVEWLGVQKEAAREQQREQAATRIQALHRGRMARHNVHELRVKRPHLLRRGVFRVELRDGTVEKWQVAVYEDRLECFGKSLARGHRIAQGDLEDVQVRDHGFVVEVRGGVTLRLLGPPEMSIEEWMEAFSRMCFGRNERQAPEVTMRADSEEDVPWSTDDDEPSASMASMASTAASARGQVTPSPARGGAPVAPAPVPPTTAAPQQPRGAKGKQRFCCFPNDVPASWGKQNAPQPLSLQEQLPQPQLPGHRVSKAELLGLLRSSPRLAAFLGLPSCTPLELESILGRLQAEARDDFSLLELTALLPSLARPSASLGTCPPSCPFSCSCQVRRQGSPLHCSPISSSQASPPGTFTWTAPDGLQLGPRLPSGMPRLASWSPEVPEGQLERWLASLKEAPLHGGILGFQEAPGRPVVLRPSLLFRNRLDSWDSARHAVGGHLPLSRIALAELTGVDMVRSGFVLATSGGRRVHLTVPHCSEVRAWSDALHSLLLPMLQRSASSRSKSPLKQPAAPSPLVGRKEARSLSARPRRSNSSARGFVPRCAGLAPPATPRQQEAPSSGSRTPRGENAGMAGGREGVRINTHRDGAQAAKLLHGSLAVVLPSTLEPGPVAGKVNERVCSLGESAAVTGKVTGQRQVPFSRRSESARVCPKVTGDRLGSMTPRQRQQEPLGKITGERSRTRASLTPERRQHALTQKVGEHSAAVGTPRRARSEEKPLAGKITDLGRAEGSRTAQASTLDKMRAFGSSPRSGAPKSQLLTARILF